MSAKRFWFECESCPATYWKNDSPRNRRRTRCRQCALPRGQDHPGYNGGLVFDQQSGRWRIVCRDGSRVYYYRAVMMAHLGRDLREGEVVHHINGDQNDDRLENLTVLDNREHTALHAREIWAERKKSWTSPWATEYTHCAECNSIDRPHVGRGLCARCDARLRMRVRRARKVAA